MLAVRYSKKRQAGRPPERVHRHRAYFEPLPDRHHMSLPVLQREDVVCYMHTHQPTLVDLRRDKPVSENDPEGRTPHRDPDLATVPIQRYEAPRRIIPNGKRQAPKVPRANLRHCPISKLSQSTVEVFGKVKRFIVSHVFIPLVQVAGRPVWVSPTSYSPSTIITLEFAESRRIFSAGAYSSEWYHALARS